MKTAGKHVAIIDDDPMIVDFVVRHLQFSGFRAQGLNRLVDGVRYVENEAVDVVLLDVFLPDGNGLEALPRIKSAGCRPEVIIITGEGDPDGAELAIRHGAWDYIEKPLSIQKLTLPLTRALEYRESRDQAACPRILHRAAIVGSSPEIQECLNGVARAAAGDAPVLIHGETGTGKELFARAIHDNSARRGGNFVVVDCASLPESLVESVLFGHKKGAFTGAEHNRRGLIAKANGGTLFLDEIGELPLSVQKSFLRVIQERRFRPIGEDTEQTSDFRIVAATHQNLEDMRKSGRFRADLLFRIRAMEVDLPPLRQRKGDISDLVYYFNRKRCEQSGREVKGISTDFLEMLEKHDWPGNVRELVHAVESALMIAGDDPALYSRHLPDHLRVRMARRSIQRKPSQKAEISVAPVEQSPETVPPFRIFRQQALDEIERSYLGRLIHAAAGSQERACRLSGLAKSRLYELLKKHRLQLDGR